MLMLVRLVCYANTVIPSSYIDRMDTTKLHIRYDASYIVLYLS